MSISPLTTKEHPYKVKKKSARNKEINDNCMAVGVMKKHSTAHRIELTGSLIRVITEKQRKVFTSHLTQQVLQTQRTQKDPWQTQKPARAKENQSKKKKQQINIIPLLLIFR